MLEYTCSGTWSSCWSILAQVHGHHAGVLAQVHGHHPGLLAQVHGHHPGVYLLRYMVIMLEYLPQVHGHYVGVRTCLGRY